MVVTCKLLERNTRLPTALYTVLQMKYMNEDLNLLRFVENVASAQPEPCCYDLASGASIQLLPPPTLKVCINILHGLLGVFNIFAFGAHAPSSYTARL